MVGQPQHLFDNADADARYVAVTRDGSRFLVAQRPDLGGTSVTVVTNWPGLLAGK